MMNRRQFLALTASLSFGALAWRYWPDEGWWNECRQHLPADLRGHELVQSALQDLNCQLVWDCHVHLIGNGDNHSEVYHHPAMDSWLSPIQYTQKRFYLNASCVDHQQGVDMSFVARLQQLMQSFPPGAKLMLLAFDATFDAYGTRHLEQTAFYIPNNYAFQVVRQAPQHFEWIASIHPYDPQALERLSQAAQQGARAIKWLPAAMGMDPSHPRCREFYKLLIKFQLPLLVHAGSENAVHGANQQDLGNPLLLRMPLDMGVKIIIAHCASLGSGVDLDKPSQPPISNFDLFSRLMNDPHYTELLHGDISAVTQINRDVNILPTLLKNQHWHSRLLNGSDYPLPGIMPLISLKQLAERHLLAPSKCTVLSKLRQYNSLLFDLILKRHLAFEGLAFQTRIFETRRFFGA